MSKVPEGSFIIIRGPDALVRFLAVTAFVAMSTDRWEQVDS